MNAISYIKTQDGNKNIQVLKDKLFKAAPDFEHAIITSSATIDRLTATIDRLTAALENLATACSEHPAFYDGTAELKAAIALLAEVKGQTK